MMNSHASEERAGRLLILPSSDRWSSAIERAAAGEQVAIKTFASFAAVLNGRQLYRPSVVVVDFSSLNVADLGQFLSDLGSPVFQTPLFAVGDEELSEIRFELMQVGFSELFVSTAQLPRMMRMTKSYFENAEPSSCAIEERVARDLPWG